MRTQIAQMDASCERDCCFCVARSCRRKSPNTRNMMAQLSGCRQPCRQPHRPCHRRPPSRLPPLLRWLPRRTRRRERRERAHGSIPSRAISPLGVFKCRSTPTGTLPTDEDLFDTIARGLDRSNMPPWNTFTKQTSAPTWSPGSNIFRRAGKPRKPGTPIDVPPEPEVTAERIKAGQDVFDRVQCWKCHGVEGKANGPSAVHLAGRSGPPDPALQLHRGRPLQVRHDRSRSLQDLYDRPGWHSHAVIRRQHQAG